MSDDSGGQPVRLSRAGRARDAARDAGSDERARAVRASAASRRFSEYAGRTDGRTFVLFTSYDMLRRAAAALQPWLTSRNLRLLSQADGTPRTQMLDQFRADPRAVLLGTDSFWQGVDVPGDALQTVIIAKLPFAVPDQPLLEAAAGSDSRGGRQSVSRLSASGGGDQVQARVWPADSHAHRSRDGGVPRSADRDEAVRPAVFRIAARLPADRGDAIAGGEFARQQAVKWCGGAALAGWRRSGILDGRSSSGGRNLGA